MVIPLLWRYFLPFSENSNDDGYSSVEDFFVWYDNVKDEIAQKAKDSYCESVIKKYQDHFPVWAFIEVLSFGDLINFCDCYYATHPANGLSISTLRIVKFLRNACALNNCLIMQSLFRRFTSFNSINFPIFLSFLRKKSGHLGVRFFIGNI